MTKNNHRGSTLPRSRPIDQQVDPGGVIDFLDAIAAEGLELHSLMVLRHGQVVAEGWWEPYAPDQPHLLYSLSKSFTATALSFAVAEGLIGLDDIVLDLLPDIDRQSVDPRFGDLRVRHLASMSTGHREDTLERAFVTATVNSAASAPDEPLDLVPALFTVAPDQAPGTVFAYNNGATFLLSALVQQVTGQGLTRYLAPRLFEPLGIDQAWWSLDPRGREMGFSGLHVTTEAIAAFGQLFLDGGTFAGNRLLSTDWVDEASSVQIRNDGPGVEPDWSCGYGFQFWMSRHGFRGDGAFGQFCLVLPEVDGVIAITSATTTMQAVLDAVWNHLLPAYRDEAVTGPDRTEELAQRLDALQLTPVATVIPPSSAGAVTRFVTGPDNNAFPTLQAMSVTAAGLGWRLDLELDGGPATVTVGDGHWVDATLPGATGLEIGVRASGGWTADGRFTAELIMINTPHRVIITAAGDHIATAWNVAPLSGSDPTQLTVADSLNAS